MFFEDITKIEEIARKNQTSIFVLPKTLGINLKNAYVLEPDKKTMIAIEQVRELFLKLSLKQTQDFFVVIRPANALSEAAANALLKNLEEPREKVHFLLITDSPAELLPTILSRSAIYFLREKIDLKIFADEQTKEWAKKIIFARKKELVTYAEELAKQKNGPREKVLAILGAAIEILEKSYFLTQKPALLKKMSQFLVAYENIKNNGHIKLHLVADLC